MTPADLFAILEAAFAARRPSFANERDLQRRIYEETHAAFDRADNAGPYITMEHRLARADRLDVYVRTLGEAAGVAVEVKIKGSLSALTRQLFRYAEHPSVSGILVVTTRSAHRNLPALINGKPVEVLCLSSYLL